MTINAVARTHYLGVSSGRYPASSEPWRGSLTPGGSTEEVAWEFIGLQNGLDGLHVEVLNGNTVAWDAAGFARITYNAPAMGSIQWLFPDATRDQVYAKFDVRRTFVTKCSKMCKIPGRGNISGLNGSNVTIGPSIGGYTGSTLGIQYGDNPAMMAGNDNAIGYKTDGTFGGGTSSGSFYREQPTIAYAHPSAAAQNTTGQWDTYEVFAKFNDPGARNGEFALRRNGELLLHLTDVWNAGEGDDVNHRMRLYVGLGEWTSQTGFYEDYRNLYVSYQRPLWLHTPATLVFSDDFVLGDLTRDTGAATWGSSNAGTGDAVSVQAGRGRYGSAGLQFTFSGGASGDDAWAEQRFDLGAVYPELLLYFDLYVPNGAESWGGAAYAHRDDTGPDNNKFFRLWGTDYANIEKVGASLFPSGGYSTIQGEWNVGGGIGTQGSAATSLIGAADLGTWMRIKIHVKAATATTLGTLRVWKNDVLVVNNLDTVNNYTEGEVHGYRYGYLLGWANSGFDATTHLIIDNVRIFAPDTSTALLGGPPLFALQSEGVAQGTVLTSSRDNRTTFDSSRQFGTTRSLKCALLQTSGPTVCGGNHYFAWRRNLKTVVPDGYTVWYRARFYIPSTMPLGYVYQGNTDTADAATCSTQDGKSYYADGNVQLKWMCVAPADGQGVAYLNLKNSRRSFSSGLGLYMICEQENSTGGLNMDGVAVPRDQWFTLQLAVKASQQSLGGFMRVWLNGAFVAELVTRTTNATYPYLGRWGLGDYWNGVPWTDFAPGTTSDFWVDDIILASDAPGFSEPRWRDAGGRVYIPDSITVGDL